MQSNLQCLINIYIFIASPLSNPRFMISVYLYWVHTWCICGKVWIRAGVLVNFSGEAVHRSSQKSIPPTGSDNFKHALSCWKVDKAINSAGNWDAEAANAHPLRDAPTQFYLHHLRHLKIKMWLNIVIVRCRTLPVTVLRQSADLFTQSLTW